MAGRRDRGQGDQEGGQRAEPEPVHQGVDQQQAQEQEHAESQLNAGESSEPVQRAAGTAGIALAIVWLIVAVVLSALGIALLDSLNN